MRMGLGGDRTPLVSLSLQTSGYINFEKHRKEFEILTRLRLLQAKCRNYALAPDRPSSDGCDACPPQRGPELPAVLHH
ncbi:hypothetical protein E2320_014155 [Naja naja]|nr:hypothetical protein E2320_014155 [Naja naja]